MATTAESRPDVSPERIDESVTSPVTDELSVVNDLPFATSSDVANRFNGATHASTAALIARYRPCPDSLMQEPPSDKWVAKNEANWLNARDDDINYLIGPRNWPTSRCWICDGFLVHSEACKALRESWIPTLAFGKHQGERVNEVPEDYLRWLLKSGAIKDVDVRKAARAVLGIPEPIEEPTR